MGGKKFGVLLCADDSENVKKIYGEHFGAFVRMLGEEGETWKVFRVANGEFPDDEEIKEFDGFVITGSFSDAHGTDVWICRLLNLLKQLDSMKKKVLGICFGHQVLEKVQRIEIARAQVKAFHARKKGASSGDQGQEQGDLGMPPSKVGRGASGVRILEISKGVTLRGALGGEDNREVSHKEIKHQSFMDIVEKSTILRIIVGERPENVYDVVVLSTSLQPIPSGQILNNQM
ncbi:putative glutamine amidotransferase YLR126C [Coffea arabica]|uniref:Glutamine amidotransferase YLR126C n=1 Tax=Coffea arabica TaxID=13443 RepID=A0ABM4WPL4_COFAR